jgi:hypothetical protein
MKTIQAICHVDIEQTAESFHAHAIPDGVEIEPGDSVLVHGAPTNIAFGDRITMECPITVVKAGPLTRMWTYLTAPFELLELFEVGFQAKETR